MSINNTHHPVTPATIARWLKEFLRGAGVAANISAHSTRSTSMSAAFEKGGHWIWSRHYYKPSNNALTSTGFVVLNTLVYLHNNEIGVRKYTLIVMSELEPQKYN